MGIYLSYNAILIILIIICLVSLIGLIVAFKTSPIEPLADHPVLTITSGIGLILSIGFIVGVIELIGRGFGG